MDAYSVAEEMLGGMELSPGQAAQLQAIDREYQQRLYTLLHGPPATGTPDGSESYSRGAGREPTPDELAELRAMLVSGIRGILSTEQRDLLDR